MLPSYFLLHGRFLGTQTLLVNRKATPTSVQISPTIVRMLGTTPILNSEGGSTLRYAVDIIKGKMHMFGKHWKCRGLYRVQRSNKQSTSSAPQRYCQLRITTWPLNNGWNVQCSGLFLECIWQTNIASNPSISEIRNNVWRGGRIRPNSDDGVSTDLRGRSHASLDNNYVVAKKQVGRCHQTVDSFSVSTILCRTIAQRSGIREAYVCHLSCPCADTTRTWYILGRLA